MLRSKGWHIFGTTAHGLRACMKSTVPTVAPPVLNGMARVPISGTGIQTGKTNIQHCNDDGIMIGVDGVLGLDYKVKGAPIDVSLDWRPLFSR